MAMEFSGEYRIPAKVQLVWEALNDPAALSACIAGCTLAEHRARTIREYLVSRGVDADRLGVVLYGSQRPICHEPVDACWAQNRRAVVRLTALMGPEKTSGPRVPSRFAARSNERTCCTLARLAAQR